MGADLLAKYKESRYTVITRSTVGLEDHVEMVTIESQSTVARREKVFWKSKISESTQKTITKVKQMKIKGGEED